MAPKAVWLLYVNNRTCDDCAPEVVGVFTSRRKAIKEATAEMRRWLLHPFRIATELGDGVITFYPTAPVGVHNSSADALREMGSAEEWMYRLQETPINKVF